MQEEGTPEEEGTQSQSMGEPLIELRGVSKAFGDRIVLDEVDLVIYPNEAVGIIGPSGTGKSTILRLIAGLIAPDAGEIYLKGQRRVGLVDEGKDPFGVGMVFQRAALFDSLTVDENVGFLLYQHSRLPRQQIRQQWSGCWKWSDCRERAIAIRRNSLAECASGSALLALL
jgi:ABC-type transport system involved in resistance to organic solvents, ATPase component